MWARAAVAAISCFGFVYIVIVDRAALATPKEDASCVPIYAIPERTPAYSAESVFVAEVTPEQYSSASQVGILNMSLLSRNRSAWSNHNPAPMLRWAVLRNGREIGSGGSAIDRLRNQYRRTAAQVFNFELDPVHPWVRAYFRGAYSQNGPLNAVLSVNAFLRGAGSNGGVPSREAREDERTHQEKDAHYVEISLSFRSRCHAELRAQVSLITLAAIGLVFLGWRLVLVSRKVGVGTLTLAVACVLLIYAISVAGYETCDPWTKVRPDANENYQSSNRSA